MLAAVTSVVGGVLLFVAARGSVAEFGIFRVAFDPGLTIGVGPENAGLLRWGYLADMLGFYLLLIPLVVVLRDGLAHRTDPSLARFAAASGLAYVVIGRRWRRHPRCGLAGADPGVLGRKRGSP